MVLFVFKLHNHLLQQLFILVVGVRVRLSIFVFLELVLELIDLGHAFGDVILLNVQAFLGSNQLIYQIGDAKGRKVVEPIFTITPFIF